LPGNYFSGGNMSIHVLVHGFGCAHEQTHVYEAANPAVLGQLER